MGSVVQSVFVQQTIKTAQADEKYAQQQKELEMEKNRNKFERAFRKIDEDGNGTIGLNELQMVEDNKQLTLMLQALDLDVRELNQMFKLIDVDGSGQIDIEEFVAGMGKLRGGA